MGNILLMCPKAKCGRLNKKSGTTCAKCGASLKTRLKLWYIEYRVNKTRRRERIGRYPNRMAALRRLAEVEIQLTENRYIHKNKNTLVTLGVLESEYAQLSTVRHQRSVRGRLDSLRKIIGFLGRSLVVADLTPAHLENYKQKRLADVSCRGTLTRPATINRELAYLRAMLNVFVQMGRLESNPVEKIKLLPEQNVRERVLAQAEFDRLLEACPNYLQPVVLTAWYTAMRASEIIQLRWSEVDLAMGIIRLGGARTKNKTSRIVPLHPRLLALFKELPSRLFGERVFVLPDGRAFNHYRKGYAAAVARAGLGDFTFHDLRHCAINNLRLAGNDHFAIMAMSGHKTDSAFKRYNLVTEEELKGIKWRDLPNAAHTMGKARG